jgi:hypothetical protein
MAHYKYAQFLAKVEGAAYDTLWKPGEIAVNSGIYRCEACGHEDACNKGNPLPPQNHAQHDPKQGQIKWRLVVFAVGK